MRIVSRPLIKYRIKDRMGCVFFRTFTSDTDAYYWYEKNKMMYAVKEFGKIGTTFKSRILDTLQDS